MAPQEPVVAALGFDNVPELGEIELAGGAVDGPSNPEPVRDTDLIAAVLAALSESCRGAGSLSRGCR